MKYLFLLVSIHVITAQFIFSQHVVTEQFAFSQNDSIQKAFDKEEKRFQKDLKKNSNDARTYWKHANILSVFKGKYSKDAAQFYVKALKIDSLNAVLFKDYGRYLLKILKNYNVAMIALQKAVNLNTTDNEANALLEEALAITTLQEKKIKMKEIGIADIRELKSIHTYASLTNFDSLKTTLSDTIHENCYSKLLIRFLNDDKKITYHDMYLLLVGYSMQKNYKSIDYNDIRDLQGISNSEHYDAAIDYANKLLQNNPLNPSIYKELMFCYRMKNDSVTANKYLNRLKLVFYGMIFSGNGSCEKPYLNLWTKEKRNFIKYLGFIPTEKFNIITCSGHITEAVEVINPATTQNELVHFNIALMSKNIIGK